MSELHTTRYRDGAWCEQEYVGGKLHGRWTVFFADGKKNWERQYSNGRQEGLEREWDSTGRLVEEKWYHLGKLHGSWRCWDESGQVEVVGEFVSGYELERLNSAVNVDFIAALKPFVDMEIEDCGKHIDTIVEGMLRKTVQLRKLDRRGLDLSLPGSFWNHVNVQGVNETWPHYEGSPLFPILQLNCSEVPLADNPLADFSFVTLFAANDGPPRRLGDDIVVRAYGPGDQVVTVAQTPCESLETPCPIEFSDEFRSYPDKNDLPPGLRGYLEDVCDKEGILNQDARLESRIGGWPGWLQFASIDRFGRFAFQIDSLDFEHWVCGDSSIHYFFLSDDPDQFIWSQEMC